MGALPLSPQDPVLAELRESFAAGGVVLFVGPGIPVAAGLPSRKQLVGRVVEYAKARGAKIGDLSEVEELASRNHFVDALSAAKHLLGDSGFCAFVEGQIDDRGVDVPEVARLINCLSPWARAIVTTNIDHVLERALMGQWPVVYTVTGDLLQRSKYILKLHGTLWDHSTWVLTRGDYNRVAYEDHKFRDVFAAMLRAQLVLFVGYDLADDEFNLLLMRVRAFADSQPAKHFALVASDAVGPYQRRQLESAGVRLMPYPNPDGRHQNLTCLLAWLHGCLVADSRGLVAGSAGAPELRGSNLIGFGVDAQRIAIERPDLWEIRLLSKVIDDEFRALFEKRSDMRFGFAEGPPLRLEGIDVLQWIQDQYDTARRIPANISVLFGTAFEEAMGPPGVPGDPEKIAYVAKRVAGEYRKVIEWDVQWRRLSNQPELSRIVALSRSAANRLAACFESWSEELRSAVQRMVARELPVGSTVKIVLTLDLPEGWEGEMTREMSKLRRVMLRRSR
ncbi:MULTISPECIES: SIR2 family protein [Sorangium]|uniref:Uncharacterized protein n=1 Tax=Sorangium cellulosum TaxID=56 RepID=A0A4V0NFQ7_SORCE|nr:MULTISPECIES: SIR2 family protein [Sorangium]AUX30512.1 uncharacterized protein SOCE836_026180 [Sorangium cellulosum]WCQ89906.1 hypothetical protein NQZ70_02604 [Sorangium sp. Soce836]